MSDTDTASGFTSGAYQECLADHVDAMVFGVDEKWQLAYANQRTLEYTNATLEDVLGRPILSVVDTMTVTKDDKKYFENLLQSVFSTGKTKDDVEFELTFPECDGAFDFTFAPVVEDGTVVGVTIIAREIGRLQRRKSQRQEREEILERLHQIVSEHRPVEEKISDVLSVGCDYLGVEQGYLARISDDTQQIVVGSGPVEQLQTGATAPVSETYCRHTVEDDTGGPTTVVRTRGNDNSDPAFERFGLECYVGSTVRVDGKLFGTLCFAGRSVSGREFTNTEKTLVELLTEWTQYELERRERNRELERRSDLFGRGQKIADVGVWEYDVQNQESWVSDQVSRIHGLSPDETLSPEENFDYYHPADAPLVRTAFENAIENGEPYDIEVQLVDANGEQKWVRTRGEPQYEDGDLVSVQGTIQDVTERKQYERERTQSRERLSVALDVSDSGVWEWDPKTGDVYWHESCERLFGLEPGTFEGTYEAFLERVHDEDRGEFEAVLSDAVPDREPFEVEGRIVRADGETRWVKSRAEFVVTHESPRYIGVVTDVTELKDRERKIQEERAFLESTIDALPDVFYAFDDTGTLSLHNDRLETVTGYDVAEIQGMEPWEFVPDEERDVVRDAFKRVVEAGESAQVESQILTKGGETIPYEFVGGPLRGTEGSVEGVVGIGRDVTERVEYERRLTKLHETTQRLMQAEDVETVGEIVCEASRNVLGLSAAGMVRYDEEVEGMVPIELTDGLVDLLGREPDVFPEDSLPEIILREGDELVYHDIAELDLPEFDGDISEGLQFATPLDDRTMFGFTAETPGPVDQQILELARILAEQTTAALERIDRERELRMKTRALDSAPVGITISDPDLDDNPLIYVNDRYTEITGYSEAEATGRNCRYLQGEETNPEPVAQMRTAIDEDRPVSVEVLNYRKDGAPFWNNVKIAPVEDEDGTVTNYVGFQQDVTERKEYESELRETKRKLEAVLDTIQAAVFMKDTDSRYLLMNQACRDLLGVDEDAAVVGTTDHELFPDDVAQQFREDDRKVFEREETVEIEEDVPTPDGTRPHLTRKSPVYDETGEPYALCAVSTDVSELKQREKELEQFAYAASHDLREPLRVISNYLQLLERRYGGKLDEDALEYVDYAVDASERMKDLIDGLLTYSRVDRRGGEFEPTDLNDVLSAAQSNLEIAIEQTDATIEADGLPMVRGDDDQLLTVFQNLLDNAITYAGDEPPVIDISVSEETDEWVVTVADEGIGIDPDQAHRAFEIFERLHDDDADGTGMGLALCKKIVDRHGGTIWIDSVPGEGTAVNFTLPKHVE